MSAAFATMASPAGELTLVAEERGLAAILWPADDGARVRLDRGVDDPGRPVLVAAMRQLEEYFAGSRRTFDLPLAPRGNDFQRRVWALLRDIPYGATRSYGQLATSLGSVGLARAVGAANGLNPLSIVVPCHRVVGSGGELVGYAGGLDRKRFLLGLEAEQPSGPETGRLF